MSEARPPGGDFLVPKFDLNAYLNERNTAEEFLIVELGHGPYPIVGRQHGLSNKRGYVGVEDWRQAEVSGRELKHFVETIEPHVGSNVVFMHTELPNLDPHPEMSRHFNASYALYDPTCNLPGNIADEVVMANIFGVNHVGISPKNTHALLAEGMRQLADEESKLIIRETYTPYETHVLKQWIEQGKIRPDAIVTMADGEAWLGLEAAYGNDSPSAANPNPDSYYLILSKQSVPELTA